LSALTLILAALKIGSVPRWVSFIARNALGIFCLHVFILRGLHREVVSIVGDSCWSTLVTLVVVLICGAYATEFVRKMFRERLV
jgi:peptidoglycan/LPS O-acetylase OafA/YrhL